MNKIYANISPKRLSLDEAYQFVLNPASGGNCIFVGTARELNQEQEVSHLLFEAYEEMAQKELIRIAEEAIKEFGLDRICLLHRVGHVGLTDAAVIIACASSHRDACFKACALRSMS